jgi:hypothetical protein
MVLDKLEAFCLCILQLGALQFSGADVELMTTREPQMAGSSLQSMDADSQVSRFRFPDSGCPRFLLML